MEITNNILWHWDRQRKRERDKRGWRDYMYRYYTHRIWDNNNRTRIKTFRGKKIEWATRIKRCTVTPTMSDNIVGHCFTHWETKKYQSRDVRIHAGLPILYQDTETEKKRDREKLRRREDLYTYSQWQYSRTQIEAFTEWKWDRHTDQETYIYTRTISDNIAQH